MKKKIQERLDKLNKNIDGLEEQYVNIVLRKQILREEKEFLESLLNNNK